MIQETSYDEQDEIMDEEIDEEIYEDYELTEEEKEMEQADRQYSELKEGN